jgi:syntaxin 1B/2/3
VHQQEPAVTQINQGAEETHRNVEQANTKLDSAIQSAKNARRWKWYALIIVSELLSSFSFTLELLANLLPVIIIAIVVGVAVGVTEANKSSK